MRAGIAQFEPVWGDKLANFERVEKLCQGCVLDLLVLPELAFTGYMFESRQELAGLAEPFPGGLTSDFLTGLAGRIGGFVVAGAAETQGKRIYNSAVLYCPKGHAGTFRKVHLFDTEKEMFTPGDLGFPVFDIGQAKIGMMVCFDWIFPESARSLALAGAQIICHPANLVLPYCPQAAVTRAIENHVFYLLADRIGTENRAGRKLSFIGKSRIIGTDGNILASLETQEDAAIAEIEPCEAKNKRITPRNNLFCDRRPSQYRLD